MITLYCPASQDEAGAMAACATNSMEMGGGTTSPVRHASVSVYTDEKLIEEISDGTVSPVRSGGSSSAGAHADAVPHDADQPIATWMVAFDEPRDF